MAGSIDTYGEHGWTLSELETLAADNGSDIQWLREAGHDSIIRDLIDAIHFRDGRLERLESENRRLEAEKEFLLKTLRNVRNSPAVAKTLREAIAQALGPFKDKPQPEDA